MGTSVAFCADPYLAALGAALATGSACSLSERVAPVKMKEIVVGSCAVLEHHRNRFQRIVVGLGVGEIRNVALVDCC
jgi:hypothetical protein